MKTYPNSLTIWIVGASSGIGLELTKLSLESGHNVIASSRNATQSQSLFELKHHFPYHLFLLDIDVAEDKNIESIVKESWDTFGQIDRWIYNAGAYEVMRMEEWNKDHFLRMNETNYLGAVRLMVSLYPYFSAQGHGEWVWNISLSSYFGLPYGGAYSAPKAALLNLAESIQPELKSRGINLRVINHGFVKTRLTQKNDFTMPQLMEPIEAAKLIAYELDHTNQFEIRFPRVLGSFLALLRMIPYRLSLFLTSKALK